MNGRSVAVFVRQRRGDLGEGAEPPVEEVAWMAGTVGTEKKAAEAALLNLRTIEK